MNLEQLLARDGRIVYKTQGFSMMPMLRQNRDLVIISAKKGRLRPMDVALYKRGKNYVLHRVISVTDSGYRIRGDNTYVLETVPERAVLGVLTAFVRDGKEISVTDRGYQCYVRLRTGSYPLRLAALRARRLVSRAAKRLGLRRPHRSKRESEEAE